MFPLALLNASSPPSPPVDPSLTVLLLNFNGTNGSSVFTDSSQYNHVFTKDGTPTIQDNSGYFVDAYDMIYTDLSSVFNLSIYNGDFTIEAIINIVALGGYQGIIGNRFNSGNNEWMIFLDPANDNKLSVSCGFSDSSSAFISHDTAPTTATDLHVALVREYGILKLYLNGIVAASTFDMSSKTIVDYGVTEYTHIGRMNYGFQTNSVNAYIRELRIRKEAMYLADFTPPTAPFTY